MIKVKILIVILLVITLLTVFTNYSKNKEGITKYNIKQKIIKNVKVLKVIDGDTITVLLNSKKQKIRLIGINTLELQFKSLLALQAKQELEKLLNDSKVNLHINSAKKCDKYQRILARVYKSSNKLWVEGYLVEKGLAVTYIFDDYSFNKNELKLAEKKAKEHKLGIWQNKEQTLIKAKDASLFIDRFKIITGKISNIQLLKSNTIITLDNSLHVIIKQPNNNQLKIGNIITVRGKIRKTNKYGLRVLTSLGNIEKN